MSRIQPGASLESPMSISALDDSPTDQRGHLSEGPSSSPSIRVSKGSKGYPSWLPRRPSDSSVLGASASATSHSLSSSNQAKVVLPIKTFEGHKDWVKCMAWFPDERRVVSGSSGGELQIWDIDTGLQVGEAIKGHAGLVWALAISPDSTTIASGGADGIVRLWHGETSELIHTCEGHKERVTDVHFSPDSKRMASCSTDRTMRIWDAQNGTLAFKPVECEGWVTASRYSPNGDRIAAAASSNIRIWRMSDSGVNLVLTIEQSVFSLAWMYDGEHVVGGGSGVVTVWNASSGEQIRTWNTHKGWIQLSLSPTTTHLTTCHSVAHETFVFDTDTGEMMTEYKHDSSVNYVAYSPSGKLIATACHDKKLCLWQAPQNSPSPSSSMLDLPATIGTRNDQACNQVMEQFARSSMHHLPGISGPPPSVLTNQKENRHRGTLHGIFRRRGGSRRPPEANHHDQSTRTPRRLLSRSSFSFSFGYRGLFTRASRHTLPNDENPRNPEGRTWIAEARTKYFMTYRTDTLPDEVQHGCLFHLASYICYGRRDPNVPVRKSNQQTTATTSVAGISPSTSRAPGTHTYPPAPATAPTILHTGPSRRSGIGNPLPTPGAPLADPVVPTVIVTSPPPRSDSTISHSASGQSSSLLVAMDASSSSLVNCTAHCPARPPTSSAGLSSTVATTPLEIHDSTLVSTTSPITDTQRVSLATAMASGPIDEVAILQELGI